MITTDVRRTTAAALLLATAAAPAAAQNVIDQEQPAISGSFAGFGSTWFAQAFQPSKGNVSGLGAYLFYVTGGTVQYYLYDRRPDLAGAVQLAAASATTAALGQGPGYVDAFFTPVAVTPGATYFLVARGSNGLDGTLAFGGTYPGQLYVNDGSSPTATYFANGNLPATFRTYTSVQVGVVPEPSTYATLAAGLAGVGAVARRRRRGAGTARRSV